MISQADFYRAYQSFRPPPNPEQKQAIESPAHQGLFIVAGPGTGKTACLSLRILKLILVDGVPPRGILATTFTKKAAAELRSRILGWGFQLIEALQSDAALTPATQAWLARIDINQVVTGTIDSICEQLLRLYRDPGTQPPVLIEDYVAKTLLRRYGWFGDERHKDQDLDQFFLHLHGGSSYGYHLGRKNDLLQNVWDRRFQDQVDWRAFVRGGPAGERTARRGIDQALSAYQQGLADAGLVDFALLEQEVLNRLRAGQLTEFTEQIKVILVDEYQDTNLLQEAIYFEMAKACRGALNVVGDDDQSLYRFRGATVELFSDFAARYRTGFGRAPAPVFLKTNYRSTQNLIGLVKSYAKLDRGYQEVRVRGKPPLAEKDGAEAGLPVLGMFRDDVDTLAADLADLVHRVFNGRGYKLPDGRRIERDPEGGDLGDCALLCSSPAELNSSDKPRLPLHLRQALQAKGIETFNPRGQDLSRIPLVERFGGLLLECLDPGGGLQGDVSGLSGDALAMFNAWRNAALSFVDGAEAPPGLLAYAKGWAERNPDRRGRVWPHSVPILDLVYGLVHFFPELHDDPEGQIYLEVFTRQVSVCELVGKFSGRVVHDPANEGLAQASVKELLRDFLGPIADGAVGVNEELMDAFPRDRLCILSIHQSKGLEFPLTIVDVGSDFKSNAAAHAFKRFPRDGNVAHRLEDLVRPCTPLGAPGRSQIDRAFDDLYRQYFVAFSRPQDVLLLVGLQKSRPGGGVQNVATGMDRTGAPRWSPPPFILI